MYGEVKKIPRGYVATYAQIAQAIKAPRASRAVGNALNKNIFFNVPCHRVVRADGAVGGYAWGSEKKINVLRAEGVHIKDSRVDLSLYNCSFPRRVEVRSEV